MNEMITRSQEEINDWWSDDSGDYDVIIKDELQSFRVEAWQEQILARFPEGKKLKILDIGCGPAFFSIILSAKGHDVTGIDGAKGMLEKAIVNVALTGSTAVIREMDAGDLDFEDETFDLVVSRNVTHALLDHVRSYAEWKRVLKKGGYLLIFDANWHHAETVPEIRKRSYEDWRECVVRYGSDFNGNTDPNKSFEDEEGETHVLGDLMRPDYDIGILQALGFRDISYDRDITDGLWDDKEKLIYGSTPMFEIAAKR